ncbi:hypothetical protein VFPPC_17991 [Pochonia chlamydosporia 170]|uniref:Uncharacterized protein n=1 Tax=Pochonia chlamydosporia 170 TaxID=1380566 RepID=A0A219APS2_METCM|nr:hypothetical protein VFPPC_17991 [Pochonia chlamydosporia 170]OWT42816.1 hypothetical protein VFPPC_17991 [Pochonia chlamydosporia 170]
MNRPQLTTLYHFDFLKEYVVWEVVDFSGHDLATVGSEYMTRSIEGPLLDLQHRL